MMVMDGSADLIVDTATIGRPLCSRMFLGFDIAMNHTLTVCVLQRVGNFSCDPDGLIDAELRLAIEFLPERLALDVRHDVIEKLVSPPVSLSACPATVKQRQHVRMLQAGGRTDLLHKALCTENGSQFGSQHLERNLALVLQVLGQIHGSHAAFAKPALDPVTIGDCR